MTKRVYSNEYKARLCESHVWGRLSIREIAILLKIPGADVREILREYYGDGKPVIVHIHAGDDPNEKHV